MPAVAVTESWNPTDQTSQGSRTRRPSTAAERIDAVVRGLPARTADERDARHHAGAEHGRLCPGEDREERHRAEADGELGPAREPEEGRGGEDGSEHHRDVPARDDEQVAEAGGPEVPFDPRIQLGVVTEEETEEQPGLLRREDPLDRAAHDAPRGLRRADERARRRTQPRDGLHLELRRDALVPQRLRELFVVRHTEGALEPDEVASVNGGHLVAPADPDGRAEGGGALRPLHTMHLRGGGPAQRRLARIGLERALEHHPLRGQAREERGLDASMMDPAPARSESEDPDQGGDRRDDRCDRRPDATAGDGLHDLVIGSEEADASERLLARVPPFPPRTIRPSGRGGRPQAPSTARPGRASTSTRGDRGRTPPSPTAASTHPTARLRS